MYGLKLCCKHPTALSGTVPDFCCCSCRHRVSLGVHVDMVQPLIAQWGVMLEQADVKARIITSGCGDFRYIDCVSNQVCTTFCPEHRF